MKNLEQIYADETSLTAEGLVSVITNCPNLVWIGVLGNDLTGLTIENTNKIESYVEKRENTQLLVINDLGVKKIEALEKFCKIHTKKLQVRCR